MDNWTVRTLPSPDRHRPGDIHEAETTSALLILAHSVRVSFTAGGAGEGSQHLRPEGSIKNQQVTKTDGVLPAYCEPPNPCPLGYTGGLILPHFAASGKRR